jgi:hypothetical protein
MESYERRLKTYDLAEFQIREKFSWQESFLTNTLNASIVKIYHSAPQIGGVPEIILIIQLEIPTIGYLTTS